MADVNLGTLLATTLKNYRKTLTDNVYKSHAAWVFLKDSGGIKTEDGGERIVEPLMYGANSTAKSYSGYDILDTAPQTGIDAAEFNWKQYSVTVSISGEEKRKNAGGSKIVNLLEAKVKQAELALTEQLNAGLFSDGTGNNSKDLTGLEALAATSAGTTYGGINATTYTWWENGRDTSSNTITLAEMRTAFNTASVGGQDTPDLIVTTQTIFETYEGLFTQIGTTNVYGSFSTPSQGMKKVADGGFQSASFKGVPIVWDEQCPAGTMYFLNSKHMKLVAHKDANFSPTDNKEPINQDAVAQQILWMGNLTCNRRKSFYKLTGKS